VTYNNGGVSEFTITQEDIRDRN